MEKIIIFCITRKGGWPHEGIIFLRQYNAKDILFWTKNKGVDIIGLIGDDNKEDIRRITDEMDVKYINIQDADEMTNSADVIISWLYGKKIVEPFISAPQYGCINFHPAPLPEYRGRGGCNMAILKKETRWGVTAHYVNEEFDMGSIIRKREFDIIPMEETAFSLKNKTNIELFRLYQEIICNIMEFGKLPGIQQNKCEGQYLSKKKMLELMKINPEYDDIDNKIQAFWYPPFTGAYIEINGKKYTLINEFILKKLADKINEVD